MAVFRRALLLLSLLASVPACGPSAAALKERAEARAAKTWEVVDARARASVEPLQAEARTVVVIRGGTVRTAAGERFEPGHVVIRGARIEAVGQGEPEIPAGADVVDATGMVVTPGLIDAHSHLGVYALPRAQAHRDGNEMTSPVTAGIWAEHAVWPQDPGFERALAGGVTTLQVLPGSGNLIGGRGVTLHNLPSRGARAMRFPGAPDGLKMACGENPKRTYGSRGREPSTRMGNLRDQRAAFIKARAYLGKLQKGKVSEGDRDLAMETLAGVLQGRIQVQVHCYRADDMLAMLQLAEEFGFSIRSFHHAVEAYKIRDVLKERGVAVSTWADWWGFKLEAFDGIPENAALLEEAGVRTAIHSDSGRGIQRLNQEAAKAYFSGRRAGVDLREDQALRWITANPAWVLGIEEEVGTLSPGKRADVVVWDGDPLSVYSRARWVFVDGVLRYDRDHPGRPRSDFELGKEIAP